MAGRGSAVVASTRSHHVLAVLLLKVLAVRQRLALDVAGRLWEAIVAVGRWGRHLLGVLLDIQLLVLVLLLRVRRHGEVVLLPGRLSVVRLAELLAVGRR